MGLRDFTVNEANNIALGRIGFKLIAGTTANTGDFAAIQCINDTVFTTLTATGSTTTGISSLTYPAGTILYGEFTAITLASGAVHAYYGGAQ
jgi:hypothetical protein